MSCPKFTKGQKVTIKPITEGASPRDATLESYAGRSGTIIDYYYLDMDKKEFYVYMVKTGERENNIVVHEDELTGIIE